MSSKWDELSFLLLHFLSPKSFPQVQLNSLFSTYTQTWHCFHLQTKSTHKKEKEENLKWTPDKSSRKMLLHSVFVIDYVFIFPIKLEQETYCFAVQNKLVSHEFTLGFGWREVLTHYFWSNWSYEVCPMSTMGIKSLFQKQMEDDM